MWHHCDTDNTIKVEKIQKRALRVILNDNESTYDDILPKTGQSLMYTYRLRSIVLETFKSVSKLNPSFLHDLFHVKDNVYNYEVENYWIKQELIQKYGIHTAISRGLLMEFLTFIHENV